MGAAYSTFTEYFPPTTKFRVNDIPDLEGKVVIVTGGNAGLGKETVKALLTHNAKVYLAARNQEKAEQAIADLKQQTGHEAIFLQLDLQDLNSVKAAADTFLSEEKELHILFNNAGVMLPPKNQVTRQGYDLQFGINVLGHFYLTQLLLPALIAGAKSSPDGKARVVTTSSGASDFGGINFDTLKDGPARKKTLSWTLYSQSKFAGIVFANELARRYGDQGIVSSSCNPGNLRSDLQRNLSTFARLMLRPMLYPPSNGALTQLYAGTSTEGANFNGKYLVPWARLGSSTSGTKKPGLSKDLWTWMEEQVEKL